MKRADIINAAIQHYYTHKELSLIEAVAEKKTYLDWIANAQKELNKLIGA